MTRYLRIRAEDGTVLCDITDEGTRIDVKGNDQERLYTVIETLSRHIIAFHQAADGSPSALAAENQRLRDRVSEMSQRADELEEEIRAWRND